MKKLIIATRGSKLALWQSEYIKKVLETHHKDLEVELVKFKTKGDKILDVPLAKIGGKQLFTKELEDAMLRGDAHIAVHSLKDVPVEFEEGLLLAAITKRGDERDAFLSQNYASLDELPAGAVVGTTSLRRRMQVLSYRPDLKVKDLRGNIITRMDKMKNGEYDAIILAATGVQRLELQGYCNYFKPIEKTVMLPAMGQAALGIEIVDSPEVKEIIKVLEDEDTTVETVIERSFIEALDGGCQVPIGVNAELKDDGSVDVYAKIGLPDGTESLTGEIHGQKGEYRELGRKLADEMIARGARELLDRALKMGF